MKFNTIIVIEFIMLTLLSSIYAQNQPPVVNDVHAEQRQATNFVDITYTLSDTDSETLFVAIQVSADSGKTFDILVKNLIGDVGYGVTPGEKSIVWDAGADLPDEFGDKFQVKIVASDAPIGKFVLIPGGTFTMGTDNSLAEFKPPHEVTLSEYYMSATEITNIQYKLFCDATNRNYPTDPVSNYFVDYPDYPVVNISWYDAVEYCNWFSIQLGITPCYDTSDWSCNFANNGFRLPTEAEWERASRGLLSGMSYPWGNDLRSDSVNYQDYNGDLDSLMANFDSGRGPTPVASFDSTNFGLYDIAGNVSEWCHDWYNSEYYYQIPSPSENPTGPNSGSDKVKRGGDWNNSHEYLRCFHRNYKNPSSTIRTDEIGFRIVRTK